MVRGFLFALLLAGLAGSAWAEDAAPPKKIKLVVNSASMTDTQFLRGDRESFVPVQLSGSFYLPVSDAPVPAVVLLHGSDGIGNAGLRAWQKLLEDSGYATLLLNSFSGRGITNVERDQSQLGLLNQIYDAYRAVETLAAQPGIDPDRIAVLGLSRGGSSTLYSAVQRFADMYGPEAGAIALHIAMYPSCSTRYVDDGVIGHAPVRLFHGKDDDWVPAQPCLDYAERLASAGHDVAMTAYPGVGHAFDNPAARHVGPLPGVQTARNCQRAEVDGVILNLETGAPFSFADACVTTGPSVGYDEPAAADAQGAVLALLRERFGP